MKKSSLFKKISLALALFLGVGGISTGLSLKDRPTEKAEAGTGPTYTITQAQADGASGTSYGIFDWWGGASWSTYGSGYNCFASHSGKFISAYHTNLNYATKVTVKINFVSCDFTNPKIYLVVDYSTTLSKKALSVGNNTLTWNISSNVETGGSIQFCFEYGNGNSGEYLYFNGHDANTPIVTIETNEAGRNVSISAATGVKSVYLSTSSTATSGSASGTKFNDGATVYGFAELAAGYSHPSSWTKVSGTEDTEGAKYRVGSITVSSSATSISYTAPTAKTKSLARNGNGASSGSNVTLTYGQAATVSALSRTGYSFTGWNTKANGSGTSYTTSLSVAQVNSIVLGSVSTFYAQWSANKNTVTLNKNGGTGGSNSVSATYDSAMPSATMPTRTGYTFNGYFDNQSGGTKYYNANGTSAKNWNKTGNTTLYAQWTAISKDITLKANGATGNDQVVTITYDSAKTLNPGYTKTGYEITSWNTNSGGTGSAYSANLTKDNVNELVLSSNDTIYAQWSPKSYTINYKDQGNNTFSGTHEDGYPMSHTYDTDTELKGAIRSGYNFEGWFLDSACEGDVVTTLGATEFTSSIDLFAKWTMREDVKDTIDLIDDIGTVEYTPECKELIDAAREAYNALDDYDKPAVSNYSTLTAAEAEYIAIRNAGVANAEDKINAIGTVEYTYDSRDLIRTARATYDALSDEQKGLVNPAVYALLTSAETTFEGLKDDAVSNVEDLINAIGKVKYNDTSKAKIDAARNAFDNSLLDEEQESFDEDIYKVLTDAEELYEFLMNNAKASAVRDLINAIGEVEYTQDSKNKIDAARAAYEALTEEQQALVGNIKTLKEAEATYAHLEENYNAAKSVDDLINAIGEVVYTEESKGKIDAAREAYEALTEEQKPFVSKLDVLEAAEAAWQKLVDDNAAADAVDELIEAIGEVEFTQDSKDKIDAAREAYGALTDDQKPLVTKLAVLEAAEAAWQKLVDDNAAADAVDELIEAIGEVEFTQDSKDKIDAAREAYNALTNDQKPLVEKLDVLEAAEAAWQKLVDDNAAADAVDTLIDAIGDVVYTNECKDKIDAAREAYDALTNDQKPLVEKLDVLETAEAAWQKLVDDHAAADAVKDLIENIGKVTYTDESKELIDEAREAYDALTDDQKALIDADVYEELTDAEELYKLYDDNAKAEEVRDLIDAIGTVEYTDECKEKIDAAREAFDALSEDQQDLVGNIETLEEAEERYEFIKENSEIAKAVDDLIEAIGEVEYTDECKEKIDAAREAYDALNNDQKGLVTKYQTLLDAEAEYAKLDADRAAAEAVDALIEAIGEVEYTDACKEAIDDAREGYDALTGDQKALVENYQDLLDAEEEYAKLKADHEGAKAVEDLIDAIGEVVYTDACKEAIDDAREAYEALSEEGKELVDSTKLATLEDAEAAYKALDDQAKADAVEDLIEAIGEVEYTEECEEAIEEARDAYDALTDDQKPLVENYQDLVDAEAEYAKLEADHLAAEEVEDLIDVIGDVEYTEECKEAIDEAREAYDALTDDQKPLVGNYQDLVDAEAEYAKQKADSEAADAVKELINAIGEVEYTDACKEKIDAARGAYDALTGDQKALIDENTLKVLTDAEAEYAKQKADHEAAAAVDALIEAIGEVEYTDACKEKIDTAREAYNALTNDQKPLVEKLDVLEAAEAAWQKLVDDHEAAEEVKDLIKEIGEVEYTEECKEAIEEAREAYDALTDDQKALINEQTLKALTDAEAAYKALDDQAKADAVEDLIDEIGEVEYTEECEEAIEEARDAYDALSDEQKALVENYQDLVDAEAEYAKLEADHLAAEEVEDLIDEIGEVEFSEDCKKAIDEAREAYNALTDEQKPLVDNYQTLLDAEAAWQKLVDDHESAEEVEVLISAIGDVEYTPECLERIQNASEAYEALTDDQKALVDPDLLDLLDDDIAEYNKLEQDHIKAQEVIDLIEAIGEVEYTEECENAIESARDAYNLLTEDQKALVGERLLGVLEQAEEEYAKLLVDHEAAELVEGLIDLIGEVEYTDECKFKIDLALDAYVELTDDQKALVSASKLGALEDAIEEYAKLEEDHNKAEETVALIESIGTVTFSNESLQKIQDARSSYNALSNDQKALVGETELAKLEAAETRYAELEEAANREVIIDDSSKVKVETNDGTGFPEDINLKVEVKTSITAQEGSAEYDVVKGFLAKNECIAHVYDVKLIQTIGGLERVIQPSDIKPGMKISVHITLPSDIDVKNIKVIHIHSADDIELIKDFTVVDGEIIFTVNRLSEFAFVSLDRALPGWAVAFIVIAGCLLVLLAFYFSFVILSKWIKEDGKPVRAMKLGKNKEGKVRLLVLPCKIRYRDPSKVFDSKSEVK